MKQQFTPNRRQRLYDGFAMVSQDDPLPVSLSEIFRPPPLSAFADLWTKRPEWRRQGEARRHPGVRLIEAAPKTKIANPTPIKAKLIETNISVILRRDNLDPFVTRTTRRSH